MKFPIRPFGRLVTSLGAQNIADHEASDQQDVRNGDGQLVNRYGWRNVAARQSDFSAGYAFKYLKGIDSNNATVEEYVTVEHIAGGTNKNKAFSRDVTTGAPTEIKDGATVLDLHKSAWNSVQWRDRAYFWNNADTGGYALSKHDIGDATSWDPIQNPTDPTTAITLELIKNTSTNSTLKYREFAYTGINTTTEIDYNSSKATATGSNVSEGHLIIAHTGKGRATITITLDGAGPGQQDLQYNDIFYLKVSNLDGKGKFGWDPYSLKVSTINADATDTQELEMVAVQTDDANGNGTSIYMFKYPRGHDRSLRTGSKKIKKLKFDYDINWYQSGTKGELRFNKFLFGCIHPEHFALNFQTAKVWWSYYWLNSTTGDLTGLPIPFASMDRGYTFGEGRKIDGHIYPMGIAPRLKGTDGGSTDKWVIVASRNDDPERVRLPGRNGPWRIVAEYADSALSQYYTDSYDTHILLPKYEDLDRTGGLVETDILCATEHQQHMVWGVKGGQNNLMHSAVGSPLAVFSENTLANWFSDATGPANFTLAANEAENPVQMHSVGQALFILGEDAVYAQTGDYATEMTFTKRVGTLPGTAGINASAIWKSDDGQPGVVYLSNDLDTLYFVSARPIEAGLYDFPPVEITRDVRGKIKSHLFATAPTVGEIYVRVDPIDDALWVTYHDNAMVFRKPSLIDNQRHWEPYSYTVSENWVQWEFNQNYGIRVLKSTGELDEVEYDSSSNLDPIKGVNRDADGNGVPVTGYWESKDFSGGSTRLMFVECMRAALTDLPKITATSTRATNSKTFASGDRRVKFPASQQGWEHKFKVELADNSSAVTGLVAEVVEAGERPNL